MMQLRGTSQAPSLPSALTSPSKHQPRRPLSTHHPPAMEDSPPPPKSCLCLLNILSFRRRRRDRSTSTSRSSSASRGRTRELEFLEVFRRFDKNGDGRVSGEELRELFACMGEEVGKEEVEGAIRGLDSDGDGMLDFADFMMLMERGRAGGGGAEEEKADLRRAFEMFEGGEVITAGGVRRVLARLGEERTYVECEAMVRAFDLDGNGELSFHEFCQMMS